MLLFSRSLPVLLLFRVASVRAARVNQQQLLLTHSGTASKAASSTFSHNTSPPISSGLGFKYNEEVSISTKLSSEPSVHRLSLETLPAQWTMEALVSKLATSQSTDDICLLVEHVISPVEDPQSQISRAKDDSKEPQVSLLASVEVQDAIATQLITFLGQDSAIWQTISNRNPWLELTFPNQPQATSPSALTCLEGLRTLFQSTNPPIAFSRSLTQLALHLTVSPPNVTAFTTWIPHWSTGTEDLASHPLLPSSTTELVNNLLRTLDQIVHHPLLWGRLPFLENLDHREPILTILAALHPLIAETDFTTFRSYFVVLAACNASDLIREQFDMILSRPDPVIPVVSYDPLAKPGLPEGEKRVHSSATSTVIARSGFGTDVVDYLFALGDEEGGWMAFRADALQRRGVVNLGEHASVLEDRGSTFGLGFDRVAGGKAVPRLGLNKVEEERLREGMWTMFQRYRDIAARERKITEVDAEIGEGWWEIEGALGWRDDDEDEDEEVVGMGMPVSADNSTEGRKERRKDVVEHLVDERMQDGEELEKGDEFVWRGVDGEGEEVVVRWNLVEKAMGRMCEEPGT